MLTISPTNTIAYVNEAVYFRISGDIDVWSQDVEITVTQGDSKDVKIDRGHSDTMTFYANKEADYVLTVTYGNSKIEINIRIISKDEFYVFEETTPEPGSKEYGVYPRQSIINNNLKLVLDQLTNTNAKVNQLMTLIGLVSSLAGIVLTLAQLGQKIDDIDVSGGYGKTIVPSSNAR